ncbi:hypothetical protein HYX16_05130 [Candidatus Woesearchaeota archaeon]|nr:hypothetical protein [Candidatus Woesearchaeota archaeon]
MKRGFLLIFLLIFLLPSALAEINLDSITPLVYNLGDNIKLSGTVSEEGGFNGIIRTELNCVESSISLSSKVININQNQLYGIAEDFTIPDILTGKCKLIVFLEKNNALIGKKESNEFQVTKGLDGNFVLVNSKLQLGKDIEANGDIFKKDGKRINGIIDVHLKKNGKVLMINTINVENGKFSFVMPSSFVSTGSYSIDFNARDVNGNIGVFTEAIKFEITNLLNLELLVKKATVNAGDQFEIEGSIKDIYENRVNKGTYIIKFNSREYTGNIAFGDFSHIINVDQNIKSGQQNIIVEVMDENGNTGSATSSIKILAKAERIEIKLGGDAYKPGDKVNINAFIYDQGGEIYNHDLKIEIRDTENKKIFDKIISNNILFDLPQNSKPGEWTIKGLMIDLIGEKKFYVSEVKKIDFNINGQTLVIVNSGNVLYEETVNVRLENLGAGTTITKKITLDPGESTSLDLGKEVSSGVYKVIINDKLFDNVNISGTSILPYKKNSNILFITAVFIILGILFYFKNRRKMEFKRNFSNDFIRKEAQQAGKYISNVERTLKKEMINVGRDFKRIEPNKFFGNKIDTNKLRTDKLDEYRKKSSYLKRRDKDSDDFSDGMSNMFK